MRLAVAHLHTKTKLKVLENFCRDNGIHLNVQTPAGTPPFGYRISEDGSEHVKDETEYPVLRRIMKLYRDNYSLQLIADTLNEEGVAARGTKGWHRTTISRIVKRHSKSF